MTVAELIRLNLGAGYDPCAGSKILAERKAA
jgi:hypothetical protein